jgi:peptidoglycan hydrolase-like protein with peptidoglycan-binding domain
LLSAGLGVAASFLIISPTQQKMQTAPAKPTLITAQVGLKKIENTIITRGVVKPTESYYIGYGQLLKTGATDKSGGNEILTSVFVHVGDELSAGSVLADVNERPVMIMQGDLTMYRDIQPGVEGGDVKQLQQNLKNLGFYRGAISGVYDSATWGAVEQFYKSKGYKTREVDVPPTPEQLKADPNAKSVKAATVPKTEVQFIKQMPVHVSSVAKDVGFGVPEAIAILTPSALQVESTIPNNQESLVRSGDAVSMYLTETNIITGKVGEKKTAENSGNPGDNSSANTTTYSLIPDQPLPFEMANRDIKIIFKTASTADKVLTVPLGAIASDASGGTYVNLVDEHDAISRVNVKTGVQGDGQIEVTPTEPDRIKEGARVLIGQ